MSAALALILLAEAASACEPADAPLLAGGATLVRPVGTSEPVPFERLGPATRLPRSDAVHDAAAGAQTDEPQPRPDDEAETAGEQCEAPIHIV